jgi:hypothetical protein
LFEQFDAMLRQAGYIAMSGQIVDASPVENRPLFFLHQQAAQQLLTSLSVHFGADPQPKLKSHPGGPFFSSDFQDVA